MSARASCPGPWWVTFAEDGRRRVLVGMKFDRDARLVGVKEFGDEDSVPIGAVEIAARRFLARHRPAVVEASAIAQRSAA